MKLKLSLALILGIITFSSASLADTKIPLFTATSDAFSGTMNVGVDVDVDSNISDIYYTKSGMNTPVSLADLPSGVVIYQSGGKDAIIIMAQNFNSTSGGPLTLNYLYDGIQNIYHFFNFSITRQGQAWSAVANDQNGIPQKFTTMYLAAKRVFGSVIGIENITVQ